MLGRWRRHTAIGIDEAIQIVAAHALACARVELSAHIGQRQIALGRSLLDVAHSRNDIRRRPLAGQSSLNDAPGCHAKRSAHHVARYINNLRDGHADAVDGRIAVERQNARLLDQG